MSLKSILHKIEQYSKNPSKVRKHARKLARLQRKKALILACIFALYSSNMAYALPEGGNVVAGQANITQNNTNMTINQSSQNAIINWNSFSIAEKEAFIHNMPSAQSAALHRVIGSGSSDLAGLLQSNANIYLVNPNGITIHQGAQINVGGFVATTNDITNENFMNGNYLFDIAGKEGAAVINHGNISIADAGFAVLVAPTVRNDGVIAGKLAKVVLASGESYVLDLHGDELIRFKVDESDVNSLYTLKGEQVGVENTGTIKAEGGIVVMTTAQLDNIVINSVNNTGVIEANSATSSGGQIIFGASGDISNTGRLSASSSVKDGGAITILADNEAYISGTIEANGEHAGGRVDITATKNVELENATILAEGSSGGLIRLGGEFQGGDNLGGVTAEQREGFEGRFSSAPKLEDTQSLTVDKNSTINAGNDGTVIAWSDGTTKVNGTWTAKYLETSGKYLAVEEDINVKVGDLWLLDPTNVTISSNANSSDPLQSDWTNFNNTWVQNQLSSMAAGGILSIQATNRISVLADIIWNTNTILALATTAPDSIVVVENATLSPNTLGTLHIDSNLSVENGGHVVFNQFSALGAGNSKLLINNNARVDFNGYNTILDEINLYGGVLNINAQNNPLGGLLGDRIEFNSLLIDSDATLKYTAPSPSTFMLNVLSGGLVNLSGSLIAGDNDTIDFGVNPATFIFGGRNSTKAGHAIQAGKVVIQNASSDTTLHPFSIYAKEVSLNGTVTGISNTNTTPGVTIDGDRPQVEHSYGTDVVVAYTSEAPSPTPEPNPNYNDEEEKINNSITALDKELQKQNEYLQALMENLSEYQLQVLRSLSPSQLAWFYSLSEASRLKFLSLSANDRDKLMGLEAYTQQLDDLLELPISQLLAVLSLNPLQLQAFVDMPARDWTRILDLELTGTEFQRLFSLSEEQFEQLFTLTDSQLNDLLNLPDGYYSTALDLSFAELQAILNFSSEIQHDLLALSFGTRTAFLNLDDETQKRILSFNLSTSQYHTLFGLPLEKREQIIGTWFSTDHVQTILNLSDELRDIVLALPTDSIHKLADIWLMLELPANELPNALLLASMFSGIGMENIMTLTAEQREKVLALASEYPVNDLLNLVTLDEVQRAFVIEMQPSRTTINALNSLNELEFNSIMAMERVATEVLLDAAYSTSQLKNFLNMSTLAQNYILVNAEELGPTYTRRITELSSQEIHTLILLGVPAGNLRNLIDTPAEERAAIFNVQIDLSAVDTVATSFANVPANYDDPNLTHEQKIRLLMDSIDGPSGATIAGFVNDAVNNGDWSFLDIPLADLEAEVSKRVSAFLTNEWANQIISNINNASGAFREEQIDIELDDGVNYVAPVVQKVQVFIPKTDEELEEYYSTVQMMVDQVSDRINGKYYERDHRTFTEWHKDQTSAFNSLFNTIINAANHGLGIINELTNSNLRISNVNLHHILRQLAYAVNPDIEVGTKLD